MKFYPGARALFSLLIMVPVALAVAQDASSIESSNSSSPLPDRSMEMSRYLREVTESWGLSRERKEKRICTLVRIETVARTAYLKDPFEILRVANEIASSAGKVAPDFSTVIAETIAAVPAVARAHGAKEQFVKAAEEPKREAEVEEQARRATAAGKKTTLEQAARADTAARDAERAAEDANRLAETERINALKFSSAAARVAAGQASAKEKAAQAARVALAASEVKLGRIAAAEQAARAVVELEPDNVESINSAEKWTARRAAAEQEKIVAAAKVADAVSEAAAAKAEADRMVSALSTIEPAVRGSENSSQLSTGSWLKRGIVFGENSALRFGADFSARYDDNIFLTQNDEVDDEIISFSPTAVFTFGQSSLVQGSLILREDFMRYVRRHDNVNLGTFQGQAAYAGGKLTFNASTYYRQLYQNDQSTVVSGRREIIRRDEIGGTAKAEFSMTPKTNAGAGVDYSRVDYRTQGLTDNQSIGIPISLFYAVAPKLDLSLGYTHGTAKVDLPNGESVDRYYNVGARGTFTPKLTGNFSVGYRTRKPDVGMKDTMWGFDGEFSYEVTPKTGAALSISRDFSNGPLGESVKNTGLNLRLSTTFDPQWQGGLSIAYRGINYGGRRDDDFFEGSLTASYLYSSWLSMTAGYSHRANRSTVDAAEYSDNVLSAGVNLMFK